LHRFLPDARYGHEEFSADLLKGADVRHILGGAVPMPDGWTMVLSIQRGLGHAHFTDQELDAVQAIFPSLARSAFTSLLLERLTSSAPLEEQTEYGAVVISQDGDLVGGDRAGRQILSELDAGDRLVTEALLGEVASLATAGPSASWSRTRTWPTRAGGWVQVTLVKPDLPGDAAVVVRRVAPGTESWAEAEAQRARLTPRELQTARMASQGLSNTDIARRLDISVQTVQVHISRAIAKLGARSRFELPALLMGAADHEQ
jgi:DNA-binding CsgD family transcriptional regulator